MLNVVDVQSMLEKLQQRQRQMRDAAWQCHSDLTEVDFDPSYEGSAFSKKSSQVHRQLQYCIDALSALITKLVDASQQRALVRCADLSPSLQSKNNDVRTHMSRPAKLQVADICQLEVKL